MTPEQLRDRSAAFAERSVRFCLALPEHWAIRRIGGQLIDSATSTAVNYRAAGRGRSHREFIAKLGIVVEEADESLAWLELIARRKWATGTEIGWLIKEADELLRIFGSSLATAKRRELERRSRNHQSPDHQSPDHQSPDRR